MSVDHRHHWLACVGVRLWRNAWLSIVGGRSGLGAWFAKLKHLLRGRGVLVATQRPQKPLMPLRVLTLPTSIANRLEWAQGFSGAARIEVWTARVKIETQAGQQEAERAAADEWH